MTQPVPIATVFGGSGFIGRYLVRRLAARGMTVRVATRDPARAAFLRTAGTVGQVIPLRVDPGNDAQVAAAVAGADWVVNLIGALAECGADSFEKVHVATAARIAKASAAAGVKALAHVSAMGSGPDSPSRYGQSKGGGERAVRDAFPAATILRPNILFGPEDRFFNLFAGMTTLFPVLPIVGAETRFQPVYVDDVAAAIVAALADPKAAGRDFELAGPDVSSFRELMQQMMETTGRRRPILVLSPGLASFKAFFLERLPGKILTRDQVKSLGRDNVAQAGAAGLAELGIKPTAMSAILPTYLDRYRVGGRFNRQAG